MERFARLVAGRLRVPVALVSLVEADRQVFPGLVGLAEPWATRRQTPLSHSFCQHVAATDQPLILADARSDDRTCTSLAIGELGVVAYAGMPLTDSDGHVLGALCAIDTEPPRVVGSGTGRSGRPGRGLFHGATPQDRHRSGPAGPAPGRSGPERSRALQRRGPDLRRAGAAGPGALGTDAAGGRGHGRYRQPDRRPGEATRSGQRGPQARLRRADPAGGPGTAADSGPGGQLPGGNDDAGLQPVRQLAQQRGRPGTPDRGGARSGGIAGSVRAGGDGRVRRRRPQFGRVRAAARDHPYPGCGHPRRGARSHPGRPDPGLGPPAPARRGRAGRPDRDRGLHRPGGRTGPVPRRAHHRGAPAAERDAVGTARTTGTAAGGAVPSRGHQ